MVWSNFAWKRFWIPREKEPVLDGRGYFADPDAEYGRFINPDAKTLGELDDKPCVALLGEPGIGKSYAIDEYRRRLIEREPKGMVLAIDCRWDHDLEKEIFASDRFFNWHTKGAQFTLIIDSIDKHPKGPVHVANMLISRLSRRSVDNLRLRMTCRTAEWPTTLDEQLPRLWSVNGPERRAVVYALAPLRQTDVEHAAGAGAEAFLEQVRQRGAQPLAIKPITLRFMLEEHATRGELPRTRAKLYEEGCKRLCEETSSSREDANRTGNLGIQERLAIAARIAAVCILCRKSLVHVGHLRGSLAPESVRIDDLVGGMEPTPDGEVQVTADAIKEVLKVTGLFAPRGEAHVGWAHQTFAEFLAARFLRDRQLSPEESLRHLSNPTMQCTVPALRESAAWLASMQPAVLGSLLEREPAVLLRGDSAILGDPEREALVEALLRRIDERALFEHYIIYNHGALDRLNHPELARQLRPYITRRNPCTGARFAAINIALDCKARSLEGTFADIALDASEPDDVREAAARAVCHVGSLAVKQRLKPLIEGAPGQDRNDSLKGYALEALWPHQLSLSKLFSCLTPPQNSFYSSSYRRLLDKLGEYLTPDNLVEALRWTTTLPSRRRPTSIACAELMDEILAAGWRHIHDDRVRPALAEALRHRFMLYDDAFRDRHSRDIRKMDVEGDGVRRRLLAQALMALPHWSEREPFFYVQREHITTQDAPWAIEQMMVEPSSTQRARWAEVILGLSGRWTFDVVEAVLPALKVVKELQDVMPWWASPPLVEHGVELGSPESRWMRREARRARKLREKQRRRLSHRPKRRRRRSARRFIRFAIRRFEEGELNCGWRVQHALMDAPNGECSSNAYKWNLSEFYRWRAADEETKSAILRVGRAYLLNVDERSDEWLGQDKIYLPARAGYRYLRLIESLDPEWLDHNASEIWARWSAITLAFEPNPTEEGKKLIARAYRAKPARVLDALRLLLLDDNKRDDHPSAVFRVEDCWDEALGRFVLDFVQQHHDLKPKFFGELLDQTISHKVDGAIEYASSILASSVPREGPERLRAHAAARALMAYAPQVGWSVVRPLAEEDVALGREVFLTFARDVEMMRGQRSWPKSIPTGDVADLYIWMEHQFSAKDDPNDRSLEAYLVTPRHTIGELRDALLGELTGRGSAEAIAAIERIQQAFPDRDLSLHRLWAKESAAQGTWTPLTPREVIALRPTSFTERGPKDGWSKELIKELYEALLHAFRTFADVERLVQFELEENLHEIVSDRVNLKETISKLVEWAKSRDKLSALFDAACKENPENPKLLELQRRVRGG